MVTRALLAACGLAGLCLAAGAASANPVAPLAAILDAHEQVRAQQTNPCHRSILRDRYVGVYGWHYHRKNCERVSVAPPGYFDVPYRAYYKRPVCRTECRLIGPVKTCDQVCR